MACHLIYIQYDLNRTENVKNRDNEILHSIIDEFKDGLLTLVYCFKATFHYKQIKNILN